MKNRIYVLGITIFLFFAALICFAPVIHRLHPLIQDGMYQAFQHRYDKVVDIGYRLGKGEIVSHEEYHYMMDELNDSYPPWPVMMEMLKQRGISAQRIEAIKNLRKIDIIQR